MKKVLSDFAANKSVKNAGRVVANIAKHPMAMCMLTLEEIKLVHEANDIARG